jgi:hypothetical protein
MRNRRRLRLAAEIRSIQRRAAARDGRVVTADQLVPIPTKAPVYNGMIAPRDSWMMPPPCDEMIPPGADQQQEIAAMRVAVGEPLPPAAPAGMDMDAR